MIQQNKLVYKIMDCRQVNNVANVGRVSGADFLPTIKGHEDIVTHL